MKFSLGKQGVAGIVIACISGLVILVNGIIGLRSFLQLPQGTASQGPHILLFLSVVSIVCGFFILTGMALFLREVKRIGVLVIFAFATSSIAIPIIGNVLGFAMEVSFLGLLGAVLGMVAVELLYHDMRAS